MLGNSNACGDITATDGGLEAIKGFSSCVGTIARHFIMGITHNLLQNEQIQDVDGKIYSVSDSTKRLGCHD